MIRDAQLSDIPAVTQIYNDTVRTTTAIWNKIIVDEDNRAAWLLERQSAGFPVLVTEHEGRVLGYATYGAYRPHDGYHLTVEHSVYVHPDARGQGLGTPMMSELITRAKAHGKHVMVAAISADNPGSIRLHERLGFVETGRMPQVGMKFGRWLDLVLLQLMLDDRTQPD
ncbi:GNAT family N-acetyltransferase [Thioclava sp. SK-1]|uniref:GNAT family N-acetyltransferase n=1 Tax=Thioclava sp. SK-1 TaxID=1889770 RepID=UPI000825A21B|nr:GNAT family N-acetyltransferase [Thioclava sp. SK-1]OCX61646.1 GNAT family N-acetyltransferase [Thioclava sp. SK-1]